MECAAGASFARDRQAFWTLLRETWDGVLTGDAPFVERQPAGQPQRFAKMSEVEEEFSGRDLADPAIRAAARDAHPARDRGVPPPLMPLATEPA